MGVSGEGLEGALGSGLLVMMFLAIVGLTVASHLTEIALDEGREERLGGELISGVGGAWKPWCSLLMVTLANLRLAGRYSQGRPAASHLLQRGRSPEHLVL